MAERKKQSPLYTPKHIAEEKRKTLNRLGKDSDGAYRAKNRIDKES